MTLRWFKRNLWLHSPITFHRRLLRDRATPVMWLLCNSKNIKGNFEGSRSRKSSIVLDSSSSRQGKKSDLMLSNLTCMWQHHSQLFSNLLIRAPLISPRKVQTMILKNKNLCIKRLYYIYSRQITLILDFSIIFPVFMC